ncbi:MAG: TonB-dependent receptor [Alphaproteobacteria bacterium]|nr:TonB-dependent receptor [Alphaproteobacteria bacterium]
MAKFKLGESSALPLILTATATAMALSVSTPAAAQQPSTPTANKTDTIVVTSTRREQQLQDVPVAVTAITAAQIEELAPRTLQDFSGQAPNVFIGMNTAGPGAGALFIRGLGYADIEKTQNPSVGVVVDGVFLGTSTGQLIDAFDIRQVEVNRGPQGIFFGKNTTAGVIAVSRSLPTRETGFRGTASFGSDNEQIYRAIFNAPLGEKGGVKVGGTYRDRDGYYNNIFTKTDNGERKYQGGNVAVSYDLASWLNVLASVDIIRAEGGGSPVQFGNKLTASILSAGNPSAVFGPRYNPVTGSPKGLGVREVENNFKDKDKYDLDIYNVVFTADTGFGKLVAQSAYMDSSDIVFQDFDGTCSGAAGCSAGANPLLVSAANPTGTLHTIRDQDYTQFTQEVRLSNTIGKFDYLLGAYYYKHEINLRQTTNFAVLQRSGEDNNSWSIFGNVDYRVTDAITLSAGVRSINETKKFNSRYDLIALPIALTPQIRDKKDWSDSITRLAASWKATDSNLLYVSRSEGFRSGGFSIRGTLSEQQATSTNCATAGGCPGNNFLAYNPENVTAWELGSKNNWLDNKVTLNAAIFQSDIVDFQTNNVVVTPGYGPGTNTYISNLPKVEVKGWELEFVLKGAALTPALDGLTLSATYGRQEGKIKNGRIDGRRAAGPTGTAGAPGSTANFTGGTLTRVPDFNYALRGSYERKVGPGELQLSASYTYIDDFALATFGTIPDIEKGYGLVDAQIGYEWSNYRLSLSGKNLDDTVYRNNSLPTVFFQGYGDPRTWAVELAARF